MTTRRPPPAETLDADITLGASGGGASPLDNETMGLQRGAALSRYIVLDRLGSGGMGVVYAAYDPQLDRKVAVKLLHGGRGTANTRLLQEARALARLSDPHVVSVFDVGDHAGAVFIAMELVDGQTLDAWLDQQRTWQEIVDVFVAAGRGLSAAHRADLIHRDFKPANVMIGSDGRLRVMDFGLVVAGVREPSLDDEHQPHLDTSAENLPGGGTNSMQGTPRYMAPEQVHQEPITPRTDQFSFCIALFEALTGTHPFGDASTATALMLAIAEQTPRPLEAPGVPATIRTAITRGLARDPAKRWPSMDALVEALTQGRRPSRRLQIGLGVAAVVTAGSLFAWSRGTSPPSPCTHPQQLSAELYSDEARSALAEAFSGYDKNYGADSAATIARADAWAEHWARSRSDACEASLVRHEQSSRVMDARLACLAGKRRAFDAVIDTLSDPDEATLLRAVDLVDQLPALDACDNAQAVLSDVEPPPDEIAQQVADLEDTLARARGQNAAGHYDTALALASDARDHAQRLAYPPIVARAQTVYGLVSSQMQHNEEAEDALSDAAWTALAHGDQATALEAAVVLVHVDRDVSRLDDTLAWAERARALLGPNQEPMSGPRIELGVSRALRDVGRNDDALRHASDAYERIRQRFGDDVLWVATAAMELGAVHYFREDYDTAKKLAQRASTIRARVLGTRHPETAQSWLLLGSVHSALGHYEQAEAADREALAIMTAMLGPRSRRVGGIHNNLGNVLVRRGQLDAAQQAYETATSIWNELGHFDSVVYSQWNLGRLAFGRGQFDTARREFQRAWDLIEGTKTGLHSLRAKVSMGLGAAILYTGAVDDGCAALEHTLTTEVADEPVVAAATQAFVADCAARRGDSAMAIDLAKRAQGPLSRRRERLDVFGEALRIVEQLLVR